MLLLLYLALLGICGDPPLVKIVEAFMIITWLKENPSFCSYDVGRPTEGAEDVRVQRGPRTFRPDINELVVVSWA